MESAPADSKPLPEKYQHLASELEAKLDEDIVKKCKLNACVDRFIVQLARITDITYSLPSFDSLKEEKGFKEIKDQLFADIRRLIPGYFDDAMDDAEYTRDETSELAGMGMFARWREWQKCLRKSGKEVPRDTFHGRLLRTLVDQHYGQLDGLTASQDKQAAPSLHQQAFTEACRQLTDFIEGEHSSASFACGGILNIGPGSSVENKSSTRNNEVSPPVHIFWATDRKSGNAQRVILPLSGSAESNANMLQQLVMDCSPASFGKGNEDVLDPTYRKAGKMDCDQFASTFHPADFGILENAEQILLPSLNHDCENESQLKRLTAELYKLNTYSGPSGHFRTHVDTPRLETQVGSLVVCLPSAFKGGNLVVRHHGQEVEFDWSAASASTIQWAAFYSDCEHEIKTITQGHRITLTYNLYVTMAIGSAIRPDSTIVKAETLPLYRYIQDLTHQPAFMKDGGVLGIFCSHGYAHNTSSAGRRLPLVLKGSDMVLFSIFHSLGFPVKVLPVLGMDGEYVSMNQEIGGESDGGRDSRSASWDEESRDFLQYLEKDYAQMVADEAGNPHYDDIDNRWKLLLCGWRVKAMENMLGTARKKGYTEIVDNFRKMSRVGKKLYQYSVTWRGQDEDMEEVARAVWPLSYLPGITWLTDPKHAKMAFSHVAYGNEASVDTKYSCCAILVIVPPWHSRNGPSEKSPYPPSVGSEEGSEG